MHTPHRPTLSLPYEGPVHVIDRSAITLALPARSMDLAMLDSLGTIQRTAFVALVLLSMTAVAFAGVCVRITGCTA